MSIKHKSILNGILFCLVLPVSVLGQYAPSAGKPGSSAIHKDSSIFIGWANECVVYRGWEDEAFKLGPRASYGVEMDAIGKADGAVVSLGDRGYADLFFDPPIANGPGFDFAVFENAFSDTYLELAFVEVSSDGLHFFRFPSHSLTDTLIQTGTFGQTNPEKINNLAGKYRVFWGTPFDLEELNGIEGLNINAISVVRIIDVTGSLVDSLASRDTANRKINDPYPTAFESGGFDLDGVGVLHTSNSLSQVLINHASIPTVWAFPSPAQMGETMQLFSSSPFVFQLFDMQGRVIATSAIFDNQKSLQLNESGLYWLRWEANDGGQGVLKLIVK